MTDSDAYSQTTNTELDSAESQLPYVPATSRDRRLFYILAVPILIFDQLTKWWVIQNIPLNTQQFPFPEYRQFFRFTHVANEGMAFGLFQQLEIVFTILPVLVVLAIMVFNHQLPMQSRKLRVALGIVLGGAIGNLVDRFVVGHVTDFLDFDVSSIIDVPLANWPIFNFADLAVVSGVSFMAYLTIFEPEQIEPPTIEAQQPEPNPIDAQANIQQITETNHE